MATPAPVDAKAYYGYLFQEDKGPTAVLDALLRAIGQYIVRTNSSRSSTCARS